MRKKIEAAAAVDEGMKIDTATAVADTAVVVDVMMIDTVIAVIDIVAAVDMAIDPLLRHLERGMMMIMVRKEEEAPVVSATVVAQEVTHVAIVDHVLPCQDPPPQDMQEIKLVF